ncbi:hypothetical protein [Mycobacterium kyogaense]|uniref:hypothetical protein n=1 Tax=Mycobacterium kyogaense TaxID=2212479 RepID=UPI000DAD4CE5|nr:hypothetical protein [Mycobacterium kyogaense]
MTAHLAMMPFPPEPEREAQSAVAPPCTQAELAWDLAAALAPSLGKTTRNRIYADLGAGESFTAIEVLLVRAVQLHHPVPTDLCASLIRWVEGYVGTPSEPGLRALVGQLRTADSATHVCASPERSPAKSDRRIR